MFDAGLFWGGQSVGLMELNLFYMPSRKNLRTFNDDNVYNSVCFWVKFRFSLGLVWIKFHVFSKKAPAIGWAGGPRGRRCWRGPCRRRRTRTTSFRLLHHCCAAIEIAENMVSLGSVLESTRPKCFSSLIQNFSDFLLLSLAISD